MNTKNLHLNFADLIVALSWIFLIAVLFNIFLVKHSYFEFLEEETPVEIVLEVTNSPSNYYGLVKNKDIMRISTSDVELGVVTSTEYRRSSLYDIDEFGNQHNIKFYPDLQDCTITVEGEAKIIDSVYEFDGVPVEVLDEITFYVPGFSSKATIISIEVRE